MSSSWDVDQYLRFAAERRRPFDDLLMMLAPVPGGRAVDLGCGPGELTLDLHRYLGAQETIGLDNSETMLARAPQLDGVKFELSNLEDWAPTRSVDVIFANASLQWVGNHCAYFYAFKRILAYGRQPSSAAG
jgi:trans-aconitate 2-methyltransferase